MLEGKTLYIKKDTPPTSDAPANRYSDHTPETTEPVSFYNQIIPQNGQNVNGAGDTAARNPQVREALDNARTGTLANDLEAVVSGGRIVGNQTTEPQALEKFGIAVSLPDGLRQQLLNAIANDMKSKGGDISEAIELFNQYYLSNGIPVTKADVMDTLTAQYMGMLLDGRIDLGEAGDAVRAFAQGRPQTLVRTTQKAVQEGFDARREVDTPAAQTQGDVTTENNSVFTPMRDGTLNQQMGAAIPMLGAGDILYSANSSDYTGSLNQLRKDTSVYYEALGYKVERPNFGEILIDKNSIQNNIAHNMTPAKEITFRAVPSVIQNGVLVGENINHKGRGYDTYTFGGSIEIDGDPAYMGVVIRKTAGQNRFYVHKVFDENGNVYTLNIPEKTKTGLTSPGGGSDPAFRENQPVREAGLDASPTSDININIPQNGQNVNGAGDAALAEGQDWEYNRPNGRYLNRKEGGNSDVETYNGQNIRSNPNSDGRFGRGREGGTANGERAGTRTIEADTARGRQRATFQTVEPKDYTPVHRKIVDEAYQYDFTPYIVQAGTEISFTTTNETTGRASSETAPMKPGSAFIDLETHTAFFASDAKSNTVWHEVFHSMTDRNPTIAQVLTTQVERLVNRNGNKFGNYVEIVKRTYGKEFTNARVMEEIASEFFRVYKEHGEAAPQRLAGYFKSGQNLDALTRAAAQVDSEYLAYIGKNRGRLGKVYETDTGITRRMDTGIERGPGERADTKEGVDASGARAALERGEELTATKPVKKKADVKETIMNVFGSVQLKLVDSAYAISKTGKKPEDTFNSARSALQSADFNIGYGRGRETHQTDIFGRGNKGKSLKAVFGPINAQGEEKVGKFQQYMYHRLNQDRMNIEQRAERAIKTISEKQAKILSDPQVAQEYREIGSGEMALGETGPEVMEVIRLENDMARLGEVVNKPVFGYDVKAEESEAAADALLKENPEFGKYERNIRKYIDNNMKNRIEAGLVTQEFADALDGLYPHYVPIHREGADMPDVGLPGDAVAVGSTVKKAVGGDGVIGNLEDALARQTRAIFTNGRTNIAAGAIIDALAKDPELAQKHIAGARYDAVGNTDGVNTIEYYKDGARMEVKVSPEIAEAFRSLQGHADNIIGNVAKGINDVFKKLVTNGIRLFWCGIF